MLGVDVVSDPKVMAEINLRPLVNTTKDRLEQWNKRDLTLTGRVLIVNSLIELLFTYRFSVLPNLNAEIMENITALISNFIWKGKWPRISAQILQLPKVEGGLRLVNLYKKHTALLIQWIFCKDGYVRKSLMNELSTPLAMDLFQCNIKVKDIVEITKSQTTLWGSVFKAWCQFNFHEVEAVTEIVQQIIWFTSHIKVGKRMICYENWINAGILKLQNLLDYQGNLMGWHISEMRHPNVTNWLEFQSVINAMPNTWKRKLRNVNEEEEFVSNFDKIQTTPRISATVYHKLTSSDNALNNTLKKWNDKFEIPMTYNEFRLAFAYASKVTISTKLRDFQFRLLHNRIPTNKELYKWKIKDSNKCGFCNETDNIFHSLFYCKEIRKIWDDLPQIIQRQTATTSSEICINTKNIILYIIHPKPSNIANLYCLILKQLIYRNKCENKKLTSNRLLVEIENVKSIDFYNAIRNSKVNTHFKKWECVHTVSNVSDACRQYIVNM